MDRDTAIFQWLDAIFQWQVAIYDLVAAQHKNENVDPAQIDALRAKLKTSADTLAAAVVAATTPQP